MDRAVVAVTVFICKACVIACVMSSDIFLRTTLTDYASFKNLEAFAPLTDILVK